MSHSSLAATAASASPPPPPTHTPALTLNPRGNPNPNLGLAPRCGAHTRAGCPCRAPAIHGKLRCRMHGGRSTGPRTPEGMARLRTARTVHGAYSAQTRALNRHDLTALRRGRVGNDAARHIDLLPPDLAARLLQMPPELLPPPWPSGGLTPAQDRAVLRAEADALAPWRDAIAQLRPAGRASRATPHAAAGGRAVVPAEPHAPVPQHRDPAGQPDAADSALADCQTEPHAPDRPTDAAASAATSSTTPTPTAPMPAQTEAHAPDRAADSGPATPTPPPAEPGAAVHPQAEPHAPEASAAAGGVLPPPGTNRAQRRRLQHLQRRMHRTLAAPLHP